jgi:hypothetical protein
VKKIIGTAEDYRRLYGQSRAASASHRAHSGWDAASGTSGRSSAHAPKAPTGKSSGKAKAQSKKSGQKKPARKPPASSKTKQP